MSTPTLGIDVHATRAVFRHAWRQLVASSSTFVFQAGFLVTLAVCVCVVGGFYDSDFAALDLASVTGALMGTLSKGWRQRAWLAQALVHDPAILILDEPTDGLDPTQKNQLRAFLRSIAPTKAIIMSTHILEEAEALCDRIIVVAGGRIAVDAPRADLASRDGHLTEAFDRYAGHP